jgi:L-asparaginase II
VTPAPRGVPYVAVTRGALVESVHEVAACAADAHGAIALAYGDVDVPIYVRSSSKPFIASAIVAAGAAGRFGFGAVEIALMAASHAGEPAQVAAVRGMLAKIGLDEGDLQCGPGEAQASPLHHNCSGKHAGILALCVHLGLDPATYLDPEHPAQRLILAFCARMVDARPGELPLGVDGCGIPVFAAPLRSLARAFARLATLECVAGDDARALGGVREAMAAEPFYVGGSGRFDSALIAATGGRIVGKAGAEGVHADALRRERLGLALKVIDGARRAAAPAAYGLLSTLGALDASERAALAGWGNPAIRNAAGRVVGRIEAGLEAPDTSAPLPT